MGATSCQNVTAPGVVCVPPPPPHPATPRVNTNTIEITPIRTMSELLFLSCVYPMGHRAARPRCLETPQASGCVTPGRRNVPAYGRSPVRFRDPDRVRVLIRWPDPSAARPTELALLLLQRDLVAEADQPLGCDPFGVPEGQLARDLLARVERGGLGDLGLVAEVHADVERQVGGVALVDGAALERKLARTEVVV